MCARVVNEHATHHARSGAVEVRAVLPVNTSLVNEADVSFVNERGGLKGVAAARSLAMKARARRRNSS
jgi:hypothetical protein